MGIILSTMSPDHPPDLCFRIDNHFIEHVSWSLSSKIVSRIILLKVKVANMTYVYSFPFTFISFQELSRVD